MFNPPEEFETEYEEIQRLNQDEPLLREFSDGYDGWSRKGPFFELAITIIDSSTPGHARTEALKKLVECKDWYLRAGGKNE